MRMLEEATGEEGAVQRLLEGAFGKHKKQYPFRPMKVFTTPNCLAVIDSNPTSTQTS